MAISDRDFALLQEEVKCLRKKTSTLVSSAGGYVDTIHSPNSSVVPDSFLSDCNCVSVEPTLPDPLSICPQETDSLTSLGDLANDVAVVNNPIEALFVFDAVDGVFYKPPDSNTYQNRNTGLSNTDLEHGAIDPWWYRKVSPNADNAILWLCGDGRVLRSKNAGRVNWSSKTPSPPSGYTLDEIRFTQILFNPFVQNQLFILATNKSGSRGAWLYSSDDDGQSWTITDLTTYNGETQRIPAWMALSGNGGNLIWVSCWNGSDEIEALKLNNDPTITISAAYSLGPSSQFEFNGRYSWAGVTTALDNSGSAWFFGRMNDPQSLGLSHIIRTDSEGGSWEPVEQSWGKDWCGSLKVSLSSGGGRNFYSVRNTR